MPPNQIAIRRRQPSDGSELDIVLKAVKREVVTPDQQMTMGAFDEPEDFRVVDTVVASKHTNANPRAAHAV